MTWRGERGRLRSTAGTWVAPHVVVGFVSRRRLCSVICVVALQALGLIPLVFPKCYC